MVNTIAAGYALKEQALQTLYDDGVRKGTNDKIHFNKVVLHVGDLDNAVTALLLKPRPSWLHDIVGDSLSVQS